MNDLKWTQQGSSKIQAKLGYYNNPLSFTIATPTCNGKGITPQNLQSIQLVFLMGADREPLGIQSDKQSPSQHPEITENQRLCDRSLVVDRGAPMNLSSAG